MTKLPTELLEILEAVNEVEMEYSAKYNSDGMNSFDESMFSISTESDWQSGIDVYAEFDSEYI